MAWKECLESCKEPAKRSPGPSPAHEIGAVDGRGTGEHTGNYHMPALLLRAILGFTHRQGTLG